MAALRILVTGGRDYDDADRVETALRSVLETVLGPEPATSQAVLVHGDAPGLDRR